MRIKCFHHLDEIKFHADELNFAEIHRFLASSSANFVANISSFEPVLSLKMSLFLQI